jgi:hypothetical protein
MDPKMNSDDKNYKYQLFIWCNGKVKRFYLKKGNLCEEDFAYIHVKKRKFAELNFDPKDVACVYISPHKFTEADSKQKITKKLIQFYNHNYGKIYEFFESKILRKAMARLERLFYLL